MINSTTAIAILPLAEELALKGVTMLPKTNTPLFDLVKLCNCYIDVPTSLDQQIISNEYGKLVEQITSDSNGAYCHNQAIDELVNTITPSINQHIGFIKNVISPVIGEMINSVTELLKQQPSVAAESTFSIVVLDSPSFIEDAIFADELKRYKDKNPITPKSPMNHSDKDENAILELMLTGDKNTDKQITEWVSQIRKQYQNSNYNIIKTIWNCYFGTKNKEVTCLPTADILKLNALEKVVYATLIYLIARKLSIKVDDSNLASQTTNAYKDHAVWWRDFAGSVLYDSIKTINTYKIMDRIVIKADKLHKEFIVYGDTYREWLKSGNDVELLLGSMLSNMPGYLASDFIKYKDLYTTSWHNYKMFYDANKTNKSIEVLKDILRYCFNTSMDNLHEEELHYFHNVRNARVNINKYLDEELTSIKLTDVVDPSLAIERIVTKARFYYTDSCLFLETMRNHPDIAPREAALLATIKYIVQYLTNQVTLTAKL